MTSIFDDLRKIAEETAEGAKARVAELDRKIAKLQDNRAKESGALQRLARFPVKSEGLMAELQARPSKS